MNARIPIKDRIHPIWRYDVTHPVYMRAFTAMESRPDYDEIERLWQAIVERHVFMQAEYNPQYDEQRLYETDLSELAEESSIDDECTLSHLRTLQSAGLLQSVTFFQEFNSVSIVISIHARAA